MTTNLLLKNPIQTDKVLMEIICKIGDHLVNSAIWDCTHVYCNWLGRRDIEDKEIAPYSIRNVALSPELYSGSAGIALFLIELFKQTGNKEYRQTAIGAWLRSVYYMKTNSFPATPISFYAGQLGLLYVGYKCLENTTENHAQLTNELNWLLPNICNGLKVKHSLDIIGGNAGAIAPLLYIAQHYQVAECKTMALTCAQEIVDSGQWKDHLCYWSPQKIHGVELELPPLTGYSHGASGLAVGLLEAYNATGEEIYLKHARGAFAFEEDLFNKDAGNWIDTRYPHSKKNGKITGTFRSAWCHGAPGISLAHMRASIIDQNRQKYHLSRAKIAIDTTLRIITEKLNATINDATLCHGLLGLTDILLTYGTQMHDNDLIEHAKDITVAYIKLFNSLDKIPSGLSSGGYSPCLMVGLAGIGLHCLRTINHSTASALIIIP